jgi:GT2 family glycosyltransferase
MGGNLIEWNSMYVKIGASGIDRKVTNGKVLGVVIVSYQSQDFIDECLESLFASQDVRIRVVVVDNCSTDSTCQRIVEWASGEQAYQCRSGSPIADSDIVSKPVNLTDTISNCMPSEFSSITLVRSNFNGGYAHAVNLGMNILIRDSDIDLFWILNPDCVVPKSTALAIMAAAEQQEFSLLGGRVIYYERPDEIQSDGGLVSRITGRCTSLHAGRQPQQTPFPEASRLDYITGASMVASRSFVEAAGLMEEDYFLYYEEVDWAFRRGALPLIGAPGMIVYHRGGTTIGTGDTTRRPSPFANYFNFRNRMRFLRRFLPFRAPFAAIYAIIKSLQLFWLGAPEEAKAALAGAFGRSPPAVVLNAFSDVATRTRAFEDKK